MRRIVCLDLLFPFTRLLRSEAQESADGPAEPAQNADGPDDARLRPKRRLRPCGGGELGTAVELAELMGAFLRGSTAPPNSASSKYLHIMRVKSECRSYSCGP